MLSANLCSRYDGLSIRHNVLQTHGIGPFPATHFESTNWDWGGQGARGASQASRASPA